MDYISYKIILIIYERDLNDEDNLIAIPTLPNSSYLELNIFILDFFRE